MRPNDKASRNSREIGASLGDVTQNNKWWYLVNAVLGGLSVANLIVVGFTQGWKSPMLILAGFWERVLEWLFIPLALLLNPLLSIIDVEITGISRNIIAAFALLILAFHRAYGRMPKLLILWVGVTICVILFLEYDAIGQRKCLFPLCWLQNKERLESLHLQYGPYLYLTFTLLAFINRFRDKENPELHQCHKIFSGNLVAIFAIALVLAMTNAVV